RTGPTAVSGRVTHVIGQVAVHAISTSNESQSYHVSTAAGGTLVFRDIFWPGYVATLNGHRLPVTPLGGVLVSVTLPPHSSGVLQVAYAPLSAHDVAAFLAA